MPKLVEALQTSAPTMMNDVERNKALIRAHYEATVNRFDPGAIDEQVADEFFDHAAGTRLGPEGVKQHIQALKTVFPDLHVTIEDLIAEDDRVAVRACWQGTHSAEFRGVPPSHRLIEFTGMVFWRIADGKIRERWASVDLGSVARGRAVIMPAWLQPARLINRMAGSSL